MMPWGWLHSVAAAVRRRREDRATLQALAQLAPSDRAELEILARLWRDCEFDSKARSVAPRPVADIATNAQRAHS